jgi:hypothetical protein
MTDNVKLNPGVGGDTIGADDVAGVKYQVVKLAFGSDGSVAMVDADHGVPVSAAALPLPAGAATEAGQDAQAAALAQLVAGIVLADLPVIMRGAMISALNRQAASDAGTGRLSMNVQTAAGAADTLTTLTNVLGLSPIGTGTAALPFQPMRSVLLIPIERGNWALNVRARIS